MIYNHHFMVERTTGNDAPDSKPAIRAKFAALLGAAAILTGGCANAEDDAMAVSYVPSIEKPENVRAATMADIRTELKACVDEAIEVSTEADGTVDADFLEDMKGMCVESANLQASTAQEKAKQAEITEEIIASLNLGGSQ